MAKPSQRRQSERKIKNAPGGDRTPDLRLRRPLLYPTELLAHAAAAYLVPRISYLVTTPPRRSIGCGEIRFTRYEIRFFRVGARGFEPPTPCAQGRCATRLRYAPLNFALVLYPRRIAIHANAAARRVWLTEASRPIKRPDRPWVEPLRTAGSRSNCARSWAQARARWLTCILVRPPAARRRSFPPAGRRRPGRSRSRRCHRAVR